MLSQKQKLTDAQRLPERQVIGCDGKCGTSQFELTSDAYIDQFGLKECGFGTKSVGFPRVFINSL